MQSPAVAVLLRMRRALHDSHPSCVPSPWALNDTRHPCSWSGVRCQHQRVVAL